MVEGPASVLPVVSRAAEAEADSLGTRTGGSPGFGGLSTGTRGLNRIWWAGDNLLLPLLSSICLKQTTSHLVAKGAMSLNPSPSPSGMCCILNGSDFGP